ncbi:MAG TPA: hypothetical protein VFE33_12155 [Thermoanaerobaculia bacterium]|nr:hypothetical protein [Thermoanaerobaculia bacterium]
MTYNRFHAAFILALLTLALVASPVLAAAPQQCEVKPSCSAASPSVLPALPTINLLLPVQNSATVHLDFISHYIGQCCTNNDASLCPAISGYSTVYCSFPMCGGGALSCVYSQ